MKSFSVSTEKRAQFINIDTPIQEIVHKSGIKNGVCTVYVPHTTAGVTINENADPDVRVDIIEKLDGIVPWKSNYRHTEGNSAAHIKASIMGSSVTLIIDNGSIKSGTWQSVFFCEFDGPRTRKVWVQITGT